MIRSKAVPRPTRPHQVPKRSHSVQGGTSEANRLAVVILEVLAGMRTPQDAATALGIAPPRYYQLEARALQGLVAALEPRPKGKQPSLEGRLTQMEKALGEARRECARQQALVRAAQRSLGLKPAATADGKSPEKDKSGRRKRRPVVRALKAARALENALLPPATEPLQWKLPTTGPAASTSEGNGTPPADTSPLLQGMVR